MSSRKAPLEDSSLASGVNSDAQPVQNLDSSGATQDVSILASPPEGAASTPFLSIVIRTQGTRILEFSETLLSLNGQTCQDFEVLVMAHKVAHENLQIIVQLIAGLPDALRWRTRLIQISHGNRTTPLNAGFEAARGEYAYILDDDDIVFGHCVETWKNLAAVKPGQVLRSNVARQDVGVVVTSHSGRQGITIQSALSIGRPGFNVFAHLIHNETPVLGMAFPLAAFRDLGIRCDEDLTTAEDWDLFMRMGLTCGFTASMEVLGIYRRWRNGINSLAVHPPAEWTSNLNHIYAKFDKMPIMLPPGAARLIRERLELRGLAFPTSVEAATEIEQLRRDVEILFATTTWRITAPLRAVGRCLLFQAKLPSLDTLSADELYQLKIEIYNSTSWRLAQTLYRVLHRLLLKTNRAINY